ncbi:hypothetical protein NM688_g1569 [Phlebia brevispora]|uniref:Uncharacterized protein n=1 Tax=Phlebia brevispora TaxID=194682 RepID=A0ACC1TB28_9APHY|nr:hypothetical protein NM688_g1569 [Phlebia brevispora]
MDQSQVDPVLLAEYLSLLITLQDIEVAATALAFYEYFVTFSEEIRCIWRRKLSLGSAIFFLNRYALLLNRMARMIQLVTWSEQGVADEVDVARTWKITLDLGVTWSTSVGSSMRIANGFFTFAAFSAIRLYAVWGKEVRLLIVILALGLIYPITLAYHDTRLVFEALPPPFAGCTEYSNFENPSSDLIFCTYVFGVAVMLAYETFIMICTWIKTVDIHRLLHKENIRTPLMTLILRDGTVYFVVFSGLNVLNLILLRDQSFNNFPTLIETITSICLSRFMLHLRESYMSTCSPNQTDSMRLSGIIDVRYASRLVGNFGAALDFTDIDSSTLQPDSRAYDQGSSTAYISHNPLVEDLIVEVDRTSVYREEGKERNGKLV